MKRLKFKKWVSYLLVFNLTIALIILGSVEMESLVSEAILGFSCLLVVYVNSILLGIFG